MQTSAVKTLALSLITTSAAALLVGCGGGGGGSGESSARSGGENAQTTNAPASTPPITQISYPAEDVKPTSLEARRFLTQATFGPTEQSVAEAVQLTYGEWIDRQLLVSPSLPTHLQYMTTRTAEIRTVNPTGGAWNNDLTHSFWRHAIAGEDQLRQRVAFALSQIFVVSWADGCGGDNPRSLASYMDMLTRNAFVSYRKLLEEVSLHPMMGCYLSHLRNQKENLSTGRVPDENFAREIMQLFSIGLHQLNVDGTQKKDETGRAIETYSAEDVSGMARVFTGWSFDCPNNPLSESCFWWAINSTNSSTADPEVRTTSMVSYARHHSTAEKKFLGITIPAQAQADPNLSLKIALDTLARHPNVAPFISKLLIQRLTSSNPSPAYIQRVATRFKQTDGNLGQVVKAILLDPEARAPVTGPESEATKVREPVLRLTAVLRAFDATSDSGRYLIDPTDDTGTALAQSPYKAPSVFNFYRPGYTFPSGHSAARNLVAPELQLLNESSVAGYINYMREVIDTGVGRWGVNGTAARKDVQLSYQRDTSSTWRSLANNPTALVETINERLMYGTMPQYLQDEIVEAISSFAQPPNPTQFQVTDTQLKRLKAALLLTIASPEFQVQR